jgi:uncharacterized protein
MRFDVKSSPSWHACHTATVFGLLIWWLGFVAAANAQQLVDIPALRDRVTDLTETLNAEQKADLEQKLQAFERRKGTQVVVLMVSSTKPEEIEQYTLRVVEQWKPGRKKLDDGALLLVAKDDRVMRIEVGYGLEGVLTDAASHRIIGDVITPRFRSGDYYGGIDAGVASMLKLIEGEPLKPPQKPSTPTQPEDIGAWWPVILVLSLAVGGILRAVLGRLPGAAIAGGVVGLVVWFFAGALTVALFAAVLAFVFTLFGVGRGGLGGLGGLGGMGSGGGGGFRGGGGGFGGGGSSGRW